MIANDLVLQRLDHALLLCSRIVDSECRQQLAPLLFRIRLKWMTMSVEGRDGCRQQVLALLDDHVKCFVDLRAVGGMAV